MTGGPHRRVPAWLASLPGLVAAATVVSIHAAGAIPPDWPVQQQRLEAQHLENDPAWLALAGYQPVFGGWKSQADRAGFFLAPTGKRDPRAELLATARALFGADAAAETARCRFPARYTWLRQRLGLDQEDDILAQCPALRAWYEPLAAQAISVDFASAYLENPSSTFGHTFLRFQTPDTTPLLSPTVNYAADSSRSRGKLAFIVEGLVGGFPGVADQLPYFRRVRSYGDDEGRDIWEYDLKLDHAQIRMLLFSLWEVKDGVFDYYFLDENCSYRTLALINAAAPQHQLLHPFWLDVVPVETVKVLRDRGMLGSVRYWASSTRTLYWHTRGFSSAEMQQVVQLARGERAAGDLAQLPVERRALVLRAAAEYAAILINRGQLDLDSRDRVMHALIKERLRLDQPPPPDPPPQPPRPDLGHGGRAFSAGWVDRQGEEGVDLSYSGFHHSLVDPLPGYPPGAAMTVLGARYRFAETGAHQLEQLDLLRVESETPSTRLFQQPAWTLQLGLERKYVDDARPLLGSLGYATGRALQTPLGVLSLKLGASIDGAPALRAGTGLEGKYMLQLTRQSGAFNYQLYFEQARYLLGSDSLRHGYGLRMGLPLARELAVQLDLERAGARSTENQMELTLRKFF